MINRIFISFSAAHIYELSYIHLHSSPSMGVLRGQLAVGLIAQLTALRYRNRGVHGSESRSGLNFFQALISQLLKLCA